MNFDQRLLLCGFSFLLGGIFLPKTVSAQSVTSDGTLSTTVTSPDNRSFTITNGNQPNNGANLFHSFSQFSIPTGGSATFDLVNTPNISTIFSRVTGGTVSNVDGLIQTLNGSNPVSLFLLNPSGIIFGPNASLNIGGSFIGTTANSVKFADGTDFSAVNPSASALLTVNAPIGLDFGRNSKGITVQNTGHRLIYRILRPIDRSQSPVGLQVNGGNTLALIGGEVNLSGGLVTTNGGGHLEVGGVSDGQVGLSATSTGWVGDYSLVRQFQDVNLAQQSLLDASGSKGSIQIQGRNINFTEGSVALIQNFGIEASRGITVQATDSINLTGNISDGRLGSLIKIENLGAGQTGDLTITAAQLSLQNGGQIYNSTYSQASSGDIAVNVAGLIDVDGFAPSDSSNASAFVTITLNSGNAGNITMSAGNMRILNGGSFASISAGSGQSGTLRVNAEDLIEIAGNNSISKAPSSLATTTLRSGNANNTFVNTSRLVIRDGGSLGSNTFAVGSAGGVTINASKSVDIDGKSSASILPSRIISNVEIVDLATRSALGLPDIPTGNAGFLTINTPRLSITDGASVNVKNDGPGRAGDLLVNANSVFIDNQGAITASTTSGNGGNVKFNLQDYLLLRNNSLISATTTGNGNGGNLTINSPVIVGLENSDIVANAVQGVGGNIAINTRGLFGLKSRPQLTPESDITASSQFGLSGTVNISNLTFTPSTGLIELPSNIDDPSQRIVQGCRAYSNSRFVATGRGGLPDDPSDRLSSSHPWTDLRDPSAFRKVTTSTTASQPENSRPPLVEATGWRINAKGTVDIYATSSEPSVFSLTNCAGMSASKL